MGRRFVAVCATKGRPRRATGYSPGDNRAAAPYGQVVHLSKGPTLADFWGILDGLTDDADKPDPEAERVQRELIAKRDRLLEAKKRLEDAENDPWNQVPDGAATVDPEAALTGLADATHAVGDLIGAVGNNLSVLPGGETIAAVSTSAAAAVHRVADERDRDNDGLSDGRERKLGTHRSKSDTDNDGLPDGVEVDIVRSNPRLQDSDRDGTSDYDEAEPGMTIDGDTTIFRPISAVNTPTHDETNLDEYIEPGFGGDNLPSSPDDDVQRIMDGSTDHVTEHGAVESQWDHGATITTYDDPSSTPFVVDDEEFGATPAEGTDDYGLA